MSKYSNRLQPALQNLLQRVVWFFHQRSSCTMTHISMDVQRITLNASCMTISGERTKQLDIFCHITGFTSDFLSFIDVELIRFFYGALQLLLQGNVVDNVDHVGCAAGCCVLVHTQHRWQTFDTLTRKRTETIVIVVRELSTLYLVHSCWTQSRTQQIQLCHKGWTCSTRSTLSEMGRHLTFCRTYVLQSPVHIH